MRAAGLEVFGARPQHDPGGGRGLRPERGVHRGEGAGRLIVQKFGGTSVEDSAALDRVAAIVAGAQPQRPLVVVSAMGQTTDELAAALEAAGEGNESRAQSRIARLKRETEQTVREFFGTEDAAPCREIAPLYSELERLARAVAVLRAVPPAGRDHFLAHGEMISSVVVAAALAARGLPAARVDSREVIVTDERFGRAQPDLAESGERARRLIAPLLEQGRVPVAAGYIGSTRGGATTTLGRGGSDYTAAILAAQLAAEAVEIWTDVDGMMTADPRIVPEARSIEAISFEEASELAYFGARVLHPLTLAPAIEKGIPVRVRNSRRPEAPGTEIRRAAPSGPSHVRSIACKKGIWTVDVVTSRMLMAAGFLRTLFEVFARYDTAVDMVTTSEISVSVTLDDAARLPEIRGELSRLAEVEVAHDRALVCLVGQDLKFTPGVAARIFRAVERINILMISQGASRRNVSFVVEERDADEAVRRLHKEFFP